MNVEMAHAGLSHAAALFKCDGVCDDDLVADIGCGLPRIARVRLLDVNYEESNSVLILLIETVERGNLPAEWRSRIAAENEDHRLLIPK